MVYINIYFKIFKIITNAPSQIYFAVEIDKQYNIVGILNFIETIKLSTCTKYLYLVLFWATLFLKEVNNNSPILTYQRQKLNNAIEGNVSA